MRLFIKKIGFFFIVPFFLFIISFLVNLGTTNNYKFDSSINKIIIGDSHTQAAISDTLLHNAINFSNTSECYVYTYYKLATLLKNNPQIDTVFLGVSFHNFSSYLDNVITSSPYRYVYFLPENVFFHIVNHPSTDNPVGQYSLIIQKTLTYPFFKDARSIYGFYLPHDWPDTASMKAINKRIDIQYFTKGKINDFSKMNIEYFNKIVLLCKQKNKILIGLNTPMNKYYAAKVPLKFKTKYYLLTKNIKTINFEKLNLSENSFLLDGDHLTKIGSVKTSVFLDSILKQH